ncbi:hypothetical protein GCM10010331_02590 [Streptomyces xanthochromogenes]|nr:hypothetical protein GCM10010331_02590 [Streptomyces xanthochromogenes]
MRRFRACDTGCVGIRAYGTGCARVRARGTGCDLSVGTAPDAPGFVRAAPGAPWPEEFRLTSVSNPQWSAGAAANWSGIDGGPADLLIPAE